jgi:hypothetical protein
MKNEFFVLIKFMTFLFSFHLSKRKNIKKRKKKLNCVLLIQRNIFNLNFHCLCIRLLISLKKHTVEANY